MVEKPHSAPEGLLKTLPLVASVPETIPSEPGDLRAHCEAMRARLNDPATAEATWKDAAGQISLIWRRMESLGGDHPPLPSWAEPLLERGAERLWKLHKQGPDWTVQGVRLALDAAIGWCAARSTEAPAIEAEEPSTECATDWTDWDTGKRWATKLSISYDTLKRRMDRGEIIAERQGHRLRIARKHLS